MYAEKSIQFFLERLCSNSPEPGGGSASALTGAIAAGLAGMLAALTVNKKGYEQVKEEMQDALEKAKTLKDELLELLQRDTEAFDDAARAFKMPKTSEEEKRVRAKAIEEGLKKASEVPLAIMEKSLEVAKLARSLVEKGNEMAISDGAISAIFAQAAALGGMINLRINFSWMKDEQYIKMIEEKVNKILEEIETLKEEAFSYTMKKLSK